MSEEIGPGNAFYEYLELQILRLVFLGTKHGGTFMGSMYVPGLPKKILDMSLTIYILWNGYHTIWNECNLLQQNMRYI